MGIGISFPEGEYTEEQFKDISEAVFQFKRSIEDLGGSADPALQSLIFATEAVGNSISDTLGAAGATGHAATFGRNLMAAFAESSAGTDQLSDAITSLGEEMEMTEAEMIRAQKAVDGFDRSIDILSEDIETLNEQMPRLHRNLADFAGAPVQSDLASTLRDLEHASYTMAVGLGMGADRAQYMRTEMLQLGATTQFSIGEITRLSQELQQTGRGLDEFGVSAQQNMIALNDIFGVSGQEIARADKTMASFGGSLEDTLDQTTEFQAQFQVPGMFQALPQVIDHAQTSVVSFGKAVVGSGQAVMGNVTKQAGVFAKSYGKTIADAIGDATAAFDTFASAAKTNRRVFLGLESDFSPLQTAFMEIGVPLWESSRLIENAMSDSETAIFDFVSSTRKQLAAMEGSPMGDRFLEQLRDELPPAVMEAIESTERYSQMQQAVAEAQRRSSLESYAGKQAFEDLSNEMLNTTQELQKMWFNVKQLVGATLVQTGVMDALKSAFRGAKDVVGAFAGQLEGFIRSEGFQAWAERLKPVLGAVGTGVILLGTAFGSLAGAVTTMMAGRKGFKLFSEALEGLSYKTSKMAGLVKARGPLGSALRGLGKVVGPVAKGFSGLTGIVGGFARIIGPKLLKGIPVIGTVISAVDAVVTAFKDMGEVLSDPSSTGMEKFTAILRGTFKGVATFINNILLGIPGFIAGVFFPNMEKSFDEGFAGIFTSISNFSLTDALSGAWDSTVAWLRGAFNSLGDWMLNDFGKAVGGLGKSIGGILGGLLKTGLEFGWWLLKKQITLMPMLVMDAIDWLFSESVPEGAKKGFEKAQPGIMEGAGKILAGLASGLIDWWIGLADGMLQPFNQSMGKVWYGLKAGGLEFVEAVVGKFNWFITMASQGGNILTASWKNAWAGIKIAGLKMVDLLTGAFIGENGLITAVLGGFKEIFGLFASLPKVGGFFTDLAQKAGNLEAGLVQIRENASAGLADAQEEIAKQADIHLQLARARQQADKAEAESITEIAKARAKAQAQYDKAEKNLESQLQFNEATKDFKIGLEKVIATREEGDKDAAAYHRLNSQAAEQAQSAYRDYISETISSLSAGVAKGAISVEEAIQRLADAKVKGVKDAIAGAQRAQDEATGKTAGDVAAGATLDMSKYAVTPQMLKGLMVALNKGALNRGQAVTVTLRGDGAVTREMARQTKIQRLKNGNQT